MKHSWAIDWPAVKFAGTSRQLRTPTALMETLLNMLDGFAVTRDVYAQPRRYDAKVTGGFARDAAALRGDLVTVGSDVKRALAKVEASTGGQANASTSSVEGR